MNSGPSDRPPNRLIHEKSPYLLQHAHNPVDWFPWGEEAFARAAAEDRPIFLSIGYATCHWCHVMAHECFEDAAVAALMNETFVCIKVDREERPDIDQVYMTVCQALTGSGGWPLTIVMTPDQRPFFAATYIPKEARYGRAGMMELVPKLREFWGTRRHEANDLGDRLKEALATPRGAGEGDSEGSLNEETLRRAHRDLAASFDHRYGGFGQAPKFPTPHQLVSLLRYWRRTGETQARDMVSLTLEAMRRGGVYDQLGFGFHRYSTDARWLVPHFEKMLYDQALLALAYLEACQATGEAHFATVAREVFAYVLRDMTSPEGAFHSAEDADSEGVEGKWCVWTEAELRETLTPEEAELAIRLWNVWPEGNFAEEATGHRSGHSILHLTEFPAAEEAQSLELVRAKLLALRRQRVPPLRDDKVLTDWNGLMIAALARGAAVLGDLAYAAAAARAALFIRERLTTPDGRLLHRYRDGEAAIPGYLDDYAFLAWGLVELYEATFDPAWLRWALELTEAMLTHFAADAGGYHLTADDAEALLVRSQDLYDGAIPSGNSVALGNLLRLARLTGRPDLEDRAAALLQAFAGQVGRSPTAHTHFLLGLDFALGPTREVVIVGEPDAPDAQALLAVAREGYRPRQVLLRKSEGTAAALAELAPYTQPLTTDGGHAVAYVCRGGACELPTSDPERLREALDA